MNDREREFSLQGQIEGGRVGAERTTQRCRMRTQIDERRLEFCHIGHGVVYVVNWPPANVWK